MDSLAFWLYTADTGIQSIDFGTSPRRSSGDVMFRVKNASTTYTALGVLVTITGDRAFDYYLSLDGEQFAAAVDLGDLGPNTYTEGITLRRVTPADAPLGEQAVDVVAAATSWTNDNAA